MTGHQPKGPAPKTPSTVAAFEQYTPRLHQYLRRILRDTADIPDIVQETFKRFLGRAERKEVIEDPLAFLLGMARNVAREFVYAEHRHVISYDSDYLERYRDSLDQASPNDAAEELAAQADIARALRRLPEAHLAVLMLIDNEGKSAEEAAQITGFTRNTVFTYLMQARAKLRLLLEQDVPT